MQIVLATDAFAGVGGSETYLLTVAEQLLRLGHGATIYARRLGEMAELAERQGVKVVGELDDLPDHCDAALVQDGAVAYELAEHFPSVPQAFVCHSDLFDLQLPPLISGIVSEVVVLSDRVEQRIRALNVELPVVRLRQPIDTERFFSRSPPRTRPERALLLGNYLKAHERRRLCEEWGRAGVEVIQRGQQATPSLHPEQEIATVDIVVGKGRALLEGMACGRPAYLYDAFGCDGWVTPERYPALEADAFAGLAFNDVDHRDDLASDLAAYDPRMGTANRDLVVGHHSARRHTHDLVDVLARLTPSVRSTATPNREIARLVRLRWRAEGELFGLRAEFAVVADELQQAHRTIQELQDGRATLAEHATAVEADARIAHEAAVAQRQLADAAQAEADAAHADADAARSEANAARQDAARANAHAEAERARVEMILSQRRVRLGVQTGRGLDRLRAWLGGRT